MLPYWVAAAEQSSSSIVVCVSSLCSWYVLLLSDDCWATQQCSCLWTQGTVRTQSTGYTVGYSTQFSTIYTKCTHTQALEHTSRQRYTHGQVGRRIVETGYAFNRLFLFFGIAFLAFFLSFRLLHRIFAHSLSGSVHDFCWITLN